jgi:hypothetical protein
MKLFLAMPLHGGSLPWQTSVSLNTLVRVGVPGLDVRLKVLQGESNIVEARNTLTAEFLRSDCEKVLLVDADMVFSPEDVERIASHDLDVVGGLYCKKIPGDPDYNVAGLPGQERGVPDANGLIEVGRIGTGFLCIGRSVFERMERDLRPQRYCNSRGTQLDYWSIEYQRGEDGRYYYQGEDYSWCARWRGLRGKIYVDTLVQPGHVGACVFPIPSQTSPTSPTSPT